jgi:hypothetical protein
MRNLKQRGLLAHDIQSLKDWVLDNSIDVDRINDDTKDNSALMLDMTIDDEENVFIHFSTKTMLKTLHDCVHSWPKHNNPREAVIAIDGTFNVTTSRNHTVLMIIAMDCHHKYYVVGIIICSGEKAEHETRMITNSFKYTEELFGQIPEDFRNIICKMDLGGALYKGINDANEIARLFIKRQKCQLHVIKALTK